MSENLLRKGANIFTILAFMLLGFLGGLVVNDALFEWIATPKALRQIANDYEKAAERKEKVEEFYRMLEHKP